MAGLVVITRPIEDAHDYAAELHETGYETVIEPMLEIKPVQFDEPDLAVYGGILVTSANAIHLYKRCGGGVSDVPVYCVGKHTGQAASDVGFSNVVSVDGTGEDLLAHVLELDGAKEREFLHICGKHVAFPIVERLIEVGIAAERLVVYESVQSERFSDQFLEHMRSGKVDAVTFFSKRTAEAFVKNAQDFFDESESESMFAGIKALSISDAVLECVRVLPWAASQVSKTPDRAGMMQLLKAYV